MSPDPHFYYNGQSEIEIRNDDSTNEGSVLKQKVWGTQYVDELVQIGINQDPANNLTQSNDENVCERFFWVCQDANYNVIGVVSAAGDLTERYEYTPYGRQKIFSRGWLLADLDDDGVVGSSDMTIMSSEMGSGPPDSRADLDGDGDVDSADGNLFMNYYYGYLGDTAIADDPLVMHPRLESFRSPVVGGGGGISLCDVGHQGLMHDKEFGLVYNRARYLDPILGRFTGRDPKQYVDGMNLYEYVGSGPVGYADPMGTVVVITCKARRVLPRILKKKSITGYEVKKGDKVDEYSGANTQFPKATKYGSLSEIMAKMIRSKKRIFKIEGDTALSALKNLERHWLARQNITKAAESAPFTFRLSEYSEWDPQHWRQFKSPKERGKMSGTLKETSNPWDAVRNMWEVPKGEKKNDYKMACTRATISVFMKGIADTVKNKGIFNDLWGMTKDRDGNPKRPSLGYQKYNKAMIRMDKVVPRTDWIPGDWGYVDNPKRNPLPGREGENIIYLGNKKY